MLQVGLESLLRDDKALFSGKKIGYLSNQASTTRDLVQGRVVLQQHYGERLCCLFSPQHGFFAEKQDNMIESVDSRDPLTGLPVFSLYGEHRKPTAEMFAHLDVLLFDLVDVGTRVYTFMYTMAYCLEAAAELGKKLVVLDRPNPIGGIKIEGNLLRPDCSSFVGLYPLPMRHGLTLGELALLFNSEFKIGADLTVVPVEGWQRSQQMRDTGFPWVSPSPNMPTPETALVYPGQVIWEGTEVSEGRGTTLPFEVVGAPYWQHQEMLEYIGKTELPGCLLRPVVFEPTSGKYCRRSCSGFQIHVTDQSSFLPYRTSLTILQAAMLLYPRQFEYKQPPYEYEYQRLPMDLILGDRGVRTQLEQGRPVTELEADWVEDLQEFNRMRHRYFLYE
jgi:uncharacterized protein YbbC (DUF1343 family)